MKFWTFVIHTHLLRQNDGHTLLSRDGWREDRNGKSNANDSLTVTQFLLLLSVHSRKDRNGNLHIQKGIDDCVDVI